MAISDEEEKRKNFPRNTGKKSNFFCRTSSWTGEIVCQQPSLHIEKTFSFLNDCNCSYRPLGVRAHCNLFVARIWDFFSSSKPLTKCISIFQFVFGQQHCLVGNAYSISHSWTMTNLKGWKSWPQFVSTKFKYSFDRSCKSMEQLVFSKLISFSRPLIDWKF